MLSLEFPGSIGRDRAYFYRHQIEEWIADRPREWIDLDSFRLAGNDIREHQQPQQQLLQQEQQRVVYNVVLRHRESWYNYATVQESKSDVLFFLHELRRRVEE